MDLLGWIVVGLLAGAIARLIMPGRDPGGCVVTILLGIAGALLAGFVGRLAGFYATGERAGFFAAIVGAIAVLALYRFFAARP
ncbi:GlsB/YeaQ/YmgE family stress response membrane protein [Sphingobium sp. 3R8]|uniref:GlsB/YeaQ/YmgE family stress response membrane protein n=1 Tax=Sphingobium sp. 3R8 TaxID=2874921 RepID=UPI001CC926D0|nr:GlsB/YeaQ/YmgE family stress response membrane protein [Sphingobium sp. 3R8]MBZ9646386.1 GlsB/YeaQ/YmgE family stress response membrane protein [Sphingobium sp. 3R8]